MNKFATVDFVRNQGCKVEVFHRRLYWTINHKGLPEKVLLPACCADVSKALPKGGCTSVVVTLPDNTKLTAHAECSENDAYDRKRGVRIALNRALVNSGWLG